MSLQCGIVGLPNVGKSTLFNALSNAKAEAANMTTEIDASKPRKLHFAATAFDANVCLFILIPLEAVKSRFAQSIRQRHPARFRASSAQSPRPC